MTLHRRTIPSIFHLIDPNREEKVFQFALNVWLNWTNWNLGHGTDTNALIMLMIEGIRQQVHDVRMKLRKLEGKDSQMLALYAKTYLMSKKRMKYLSKLYLP